MGRRATLRAAVLAAGACVLAAVVTPVAAQRRAFPATDAELRAALCPARGACRFDFVLPAGRGGGAALAVVRVRSGRVVCSGEQGYRDVLVAHRAGATRRVRELVRGECPALEWRLSSWRFERGELVLEYGGMGAPPAASTDMRPVIVRFRPWPFAVIAAARGDDPTLAPELPARGPFLRLTME